MKVILINTKGLSLIEILVALSLLSIVLITFFTFFIQSANYSNYNQSKLTAIDVGEKVVSELRRISSLNDLESIGYHFKNNTYEDDSTYPHFKVNIEFSDQLTESKLRKVLIRIFPTSDRTKTSSFSTEIYIQEEALHE